MIKNVFKNHSKSLILSLFALILIPMTTKAGHYSSSVGHWSADSLQIQERKTNDLIHCLAQEEQKIHKKKYGGPEYRLNQVLINELVSWNDIHLHDHYIRQICSEGSQGPSLSLLKTALLKGQEIFDISFSQQLDGLRAYQIQEVKSFIDRLPKILFQYLAGVQVLAGNPHCFHKEIPEINFFFERFKYLEEHLTVDLLIENKDKLESIFNRLLEIERIIEKCQNL